MDCLVEMIGNWRSKGVSRIRYVVDLVFLVLELDVVMNCVEIAFNIEKQSREDETTLTL